MNYSESMNKRRVEARKRFRRMMAVMLFLGIVIGFLIGRVTAYAGTAHKPTEGPEITVEPDTLSTDLPAVIAPSTAPQEPETTPKPEPVLLGTYRITAYCSCEICCGEWAKNRPGGIVYGAAGVELKAGVSCASPLPFGTVVEIEGLGEYTVQDRMAQWVIDKYGEKLIDIYFDDHEAAKSFGLQYLNVYLKEGEIQ